MYPKQGKKMGMRATSEEKMFMYTIYTKCVVYTVNHIITLGYTTNNNITHGQFTYEGICHDVY